MKTMNDSHCDSMEHLMVDALFGDIDADREATLTSHLQECAACTHVFAEMQSTLDVTKKAPDVLPPESYWAGFQQRLEDRINAEQQRTSVMDLNRWSASLRRLFFPAGQVQWRLAYQLGIAAILVAVGVLIGRFGFTSSSNAPSIAHSVDSTAIKAMQVASQTESYLNRSSVLLLGLVNHDTNSEEQHLLNFDHKREVAGTLVQEAEMLKASLNRSEEAQLIRLIEELEKILLQIANLEMQEDMPGIEMIQEGIEGRAILLKINLETMKLMDQPASVPTTNELSL